MLVFGSPYEYGSYDFGEFMVLKLFVGYMLTVIYGLRFVGPETRNPKPLNA